MAERKESTARNKKGANAVQSNRLKLLVTAVARNKADYFADLIQSFDVNMQLLTMANGTASTGSLQILGLGDSARTVIFSVIQEEKIPDALHALESKFKTIKGGNGIAFTIPLSSVIGTLIFGFLSNNKQVAENKNG